jgi:hypothetical protein
MTTYYYINKDKINEKQKETMTCECGSIFRKCDKARHVKSKKHIFYMKESKELRNFKEELKEQNEEKQKQNERLIEQNERFMENEKQFRKDIAKLRVIEKKYNKFLKHARQWQ